MLHGCIRDACIEAGVPGAGVAVVQQGHREFYGFGQADLRSGRPVTAGTIFRLGSIVKSWTSVMVMELVEEGVLILDEPIRNILPAFHLSEEDASEAVTMRHLLTHRAGFLGDIYEDFGDDPACIGRLVSSLLGAEQLFTPGTLVSYSNAGMAVAAHIIEAIRGRDYETLFNDRLVRSLGQRRTGQRWNCYPDEDVAVGHIRGEPVAQETYLRTMAPAGSVAWSTPCDLATFGQMLLGEGSVRILSDETLTRMREESVEGPARTFAYRWGLGLMQFDADGRVFGHDGVVPGQASFLRIVPEAGLVIAVMTNGGDARLLAERLIPASIQSMSGVIVPPTPELPSPQPSFNADPYLGCYAAGRYEIVVSPGAAGLNVRFQPLTGARDIAETCNVCLYPENAEQFLGILPGGSLPLCQRFIRGKNGQFEYLNFRGRVFPRIIK